MLVSDVIRRVQRSIGDSNEIFIKNTDVYDWINDGALEICRQTSCYTGTTSVAASTLASAGMAYEATRLVTKRVTYTPVGGYERALRLASIDELDLNEVEADYNTGAEPSVYYFEGEKIWLYPRPGASDTATVKHTYSKSTTVVTATGDTVVLPISYQADLVRYCVARAHERDQNYRGMQIAQGEFDANLSMRKHEADGGDDSFYAVQEWDVFN